MVGLSTLSFAAHTHTDTRVCTCVCAFYIFKHVLSLLRANFDDVGPIKTASKSEREVGAKSAAAVTRRSARRRGRRGRKVGGK